MENNSSPFSIANLKLACEIMYAFRVRNSDVIVDFPVEAHRLLLKDADWFNSLQQKIESGTFAASPSKIYSAPKGNGLVRHFFNLSLEDQLYYTLLVMDCFTAIYKGIQTHAYGSAYEALKTYPTDANWTVNIFRQNKSLSQKRNELLKKSCRYVIHTDITAFSPNIDQKLLITELEQFGAAPSTLSKLKEALSIWSPLTHKGIPQIFWSTDILCEFYLNRIDIHMLANNYSYIRESDNIEVYCSTFPEARNKLMEISHLLFYRGLFPNSHKTFIQPVEEFREQVMQEENNVYKIKDSFKRLFKRVTHFYYLIEQKTGINECYRQLVKSPVDTFPLLQHYQKYHIDITHSLSRFLNSGEAVYPYQNYIILRWLLDHNKEISKELLNSIRIVAVAVPTEYYVVSIARVLLLRFGNEEDSIRIKKIYEQSIDSWEKTDLGFLLKKS